MSVTGLFVAELGAKLAALAGHGEALAARHSCGALEVYAAGDWNLAQGSPELAVRARRGLPTSITTLLAQDKDR